MSFGIKNHAPHWGTRSQINATIQDLADAKGNRDGIWNNEGTTGGHGNIFERQPLVAKLTQFVGAGVSTQDEIAQLKSFRAGQEAQWGQPVTQLDLNTLQDGELFAAQKAIALTRMGRSPADVTEGFVRAAGRVDGESIAPRDVFWQRFRPEGEPSGKVVVVSPGFQETGRNFYEQIQQMNRLGHDVVVMDHQWAGQTEGTPGGLDRGFGVARDVAAVTAFAQQIVKQEYQGTPQSEVVLFGNSMGAGPGVLGAILLNDNGRIELDGPPMPKGVKAVLQAPFLQATENPVNHVLGWASEIPLLNRIMTPSVGVPVLTHDPVGAQKGAQSAVLEDVRAQLRSMTSAEPDLERIHDLLDQGLRPQGQLFVVHGSGDPLADVKGSQHLKSVLGDQVQLQIIESNNHVLEQTPGEQNHAIAGLQRLLQR